MCYSAGSISQSVNQCPMCKVYSHPKSVISTNSYFFLNVHLLFFTRCPHIRETCRNRVAHPRMDVLYLKNAEGTSPPTIPIQLSFTRSSQSRASRAAASARLVSPYHLHCHSHPSLPALQWANQAPPPTKTGYNNPGWPGCCRPPCSEEVDKIPPADWPAVSRIHAIPIPAAVETILNALLLPPLALKLPIGQSSPTASLRSPSRAASRKGNGAALNPVLSKSAAASKPAILPYNGRGRQGCATPGSNNASRSSSSTGISSSLPNSPMNEAFSRRKSSITSIDHRNGDASQSSPSRKAAELENNTLRRQSSMRRPVLTPATTSVSISKIVASDTRSSEILHDNPTIASIRRGSSAPTSPFNPPGDHLLISRPSKIDIDSRSSSGGSSDGMLSDSTITSEGFTDYLSDESEEELQRQAEARAAVVAQTQMEELEFKMARQQLAGVGLKPPKSWTQTNTSSVSPTKNNNVNHSSMPSRNPKISHSFAVAATAMMQTGQARV